MTTPDSLTLAASVLQPLLALKLSVSEMVTIGVIGGMVIVVWSYANWRHAVKVAIILALLEGAIRKWVLPQAQELVYFLKDGVLLGAYARFFFSPDPDIRGWRLNAFGGLIALLCTFVAFGAVNPNIGHVILAVIGIKVYLFYIPLMFMVPYLFRNKDEMVRQLTWFCWLVIPVCGLGFLQWASDGFSVINTYANQSGVADTGATTLGIEGATQRVRVTGTFSYITGHTTFVTYFMALTLMMLSLKETKYKWVLLCVCLPMLVANALMNGSRAALMTQGLIVVIFWVAALAGRVGSSKHFSNMLGAGLVICMIGGTYFFSEAWYQWSTRFKHAGDTVENRVYQYTLGATQDAMKEAGFTGFGIGTTHAVTDAFRRTFKLPAPRKRAPFYDNEAGQILAELGFFGFVNWYALRLIALGILWTAYLRSPPGIFKAASLAALSISVPFLIMSVVVNHTANILLWAFMGLGITALLEPTVNRRFTPKVRTGTASLAGPPRQNV